ncbi:MAG: vWA domain-containing protein [Actinomycetaceae bacterium]|nr:vWA domain-containing protein [Actinomycetaceae bacterium]
MLWLWPAWAVIAVCVGGSALCLVCWRMGREASWVDWLRRALMVVVVASMGMGPSRALPQITTVRGANVYFVVDTTGSMVAEDYNGTSPRMEGVRADIRQIQSELVGARFSVISFSSSATRELPLTTDSLALESWVQTMSPEITTYSSGSSVFRPVDLLVKELERSKKSHPESMQIVYIISDGEARGEGDGGDYSQVRELVDGGAVLGYGTAEGGRMKVTDPQAGDEAYIQDPQTGQDAISTIDEGQLQQVADQIGVGYSHRTSPGQAIDVPDADLIDEQVTTESRRRSPVLWPAGLALAALAVWEAAVVAPRIRIKLRGR